MDKKYIVFDFNRENCAVAIDEILEIITLDSLYKTGEQEISVADWNGQALPVIDPYTLLTFRTHTATINSRIAVVQKNDLKYGILFDNVKGGVSIKEEEIEEPKLNEGRYVKGVVTKDFVKIFDIEAILLKEIREAFDIVYALDISAINDSIGYYEKDTTIENDMKEVAKIKLLNLLVKSARDDIKEEYINEMLEIQEMISK